MSKISPQDVSNMAMLRTQVEWVKMARPNQLPPRPFLADEKDMWILLAGRGFGKTTVGSNTMARLSWQEPNTITGVIAPTSNDLRRVLFEGPVGFLNVIPSECIDNRPRKGYNRDLSELHLTNGTAIFGFSASEPDRLRGFQCHRLWGDELAAWDKPAGNAKYTLSMAMLGLRLGNRTKSIFTTTPRPIPIVRELVKRNTVVVTRGSTYDNLSNLAENFKEEILQYEGTKLGRQEIHGEILDPGEEGIVNKKWIRLWPSNMALPEFKFIVMSLDTAYKEKQINKKTGEVDPTACTVWGVFDEKDVGIINGEAAVMLIDAWNDWFKFPDLIRKVNSELKYCYGPSEKAVDVVLIEDKGSGISLQQVLAENGLNTHAYNPGRADKVARLHAVSPMFAAGNVWVPESNANKGEVRKWAEEWLEQITCFNGPGSVEHDDYVDSTSQALRLMFDQRWLKTNWRKAVERAQADVEDIRVNTRGVNNPYAA